MVINSRYRQRPVEDGQANDFCAGDVRTMSDAFGRKEQRADGVDFIGFLPFAGKARKPIRWRPGVCGPELCSQP